MVHDAPTSRVQRDHSPAAFIDPELGRNPAEAEGAIEATFRLARAFELTPCPEGAVLIRLESEFLGMFLYSYIMAVRAFAF